MKVDIALVLDYNTHYDDYKLKLTFENKTQINLLLTFREVQELKAAGLVVTEE